MLNPDSNNPFRRQAPAFTVDRLELAKRRSRPRRREWRLLITLPIAVIAIVFCIQWFVDLGQHIGDATRERLPQEMRLTPMVTPSLDKADALPLPAEVDAVLPRVTELLGDHASVRTGDELDAGTVAWARLLLDQDRAHPPIPQRLSAHDLLLGDAHEGASALISGRIDDNRPAAESGWQRLILALDEGQFAEVLAEPNAAEQVIGHQVQLVGRYLGRTELPTADGKSVKLPLLLARAFQADTSTDAINEHGDFVQRGPWQLPDDLYADISDERTLVETRPYYWLLGQARFDLGNPLSAESIIDGNQHANDLHQKPAAFRGQPLRLNGFVYRAWEDAEVAHDQPFGLKRVVRVLLWKRDFGAISENVNGVEVTKTKHVLRLFEVAIVTDQPLPKVGEHLTIAGRFLKMHAIPVQVDRYRDKVHGVERQSDKAYTWFAVAAGYSVVPPPPRYQYTAWSIIGITIVLLIAALFAVMARRESKAGLVLHDKVKQLRATRRAVSATAAAKTAAPAAVDTATLPPAPTQPPAAPTSPPNDPPSV